MRTDALARAAAHFGATGDLPRVWMFTDPVRMPRPLRPTAQLPAGAAVVYRHFGALDRRVVGEGLQRLCAQRGLVFLVGADADLAQSLGAHGVHLPERMAGAIATLKRARPDWLISVAAHSAAAVQRSRSADAIMLSSIFPSQSPSAGEPLGLTKGRLVARRAPDRVIALGGVSVRHASRLARAGFAGMAGIDMFLD